MILTILLILNNPHLYVHYCLTVEMLTHYFCSGHRKWNTLDFRGRLMSLLAPARGMSTLPAKGGFSRPSSFTHSGVSPRPHLPQESRIFHLLGSVFNLNNSF